MGLGKVRDCFLLNCEPLSSEVELETGQKLRLNMHTMVGRRPVDLQRWWMSHVADRVGNSSHGYTANPQAAALRIPLRW